MSEPIYDNSQLQTFKNCPEQYRLKYIEQLRKREEGVDEHDKNFGKAIHSGLEAHYQDQDLNVVREVFAKNYPEQLNSEDLAKTQDYTVISVFDRQGNIQVYRDRFRGYDWRYVKTKIKSISDHYNKGQVTIDSTGVGDPIYEDLAYAKVNVVPFKFTEASKVDLINKLSLWIEQKRVWLINQTDAAYEYDNYSYELGPTGSVS